MNPSYRRASQAHNVVQQVKTPKKPAPAFKPVVAQLKTTSSAQSVKGAHPVCGPRAKLGNVQAKMAVTAPPKNPIAPPVYKPQTVPKILQAKKRLDQPSSVVPHSQHKPVAPPAYHPQSTPQTLQRKESGRSNLSRIGPVQAYQVKGAGNQQVIQRAAVLSADWRCTTAGCDDNFSYGYKAGQPNWQCQNGHTTWAPGLNAVAAAPVAAVEAKAVPPRQHELDTEFKGQGLSDNLTDLFERYYPAGKNRKHPGHGSSAGKQFKMRDELRDFLNSIKRDVVGHAAAVAKINADFGTNF